MTPSVDLKEDPNIGTEIEITKKSSHIGSTEKAEASNGKGAPKASKQSDTANGSQEKEKPKEGSKEGKISGKELKEKAKAEKAARRAKEKEGRQGQPVVDLGTKTQPEQRNRRPSAAAAGAPPSTKGQHKRTGSANGSTQKLPLRAVNASAPPAPEEPKKENKNVALFDHLYGPPRRNTIAGAGKDVHPAVVALGMQMRNYVICGSSARCVATLLAFKRVCGVSFCHDKFTEYL